MTDNIILTPEEAWQFMQHVGAAHMTAGTYALAFSCAAQHGWVPDGGLPGDSLPLSDPDARKKLQARTAFISMLHEQPATASEAVQVLDAIAAAPRGWQMFGGTRSYVGTLARNYGPSELGGKHRSLIAQVAL